MVSLLFSGYFSSLRYVSSPFITVASEHLIAFNLSAVSKPYPESQLQQATSALPRHREIFKEGRCRCRQSRAEHKLAQPPPWVRFAPHFLSVALCVDCGGYPVLVWYSWPFISPEPLFWWVCAGGRAHGDQEPCVHTVLAVTVQQDVWKTRPDISPGRGRGWWPVLW